MDGLPSVQVVEALVVRQARREQIARMEALLAQVPGATFGDSDAMPLTHRFADGIYVREIFIPQGMLLTGKIHRHCHPNMLVRGEALVFTEQRGREHLVAPLVMLSDAGTKRAVYALTDVVWITMHANPQELRDLTALEAWIIAPDYRALAGEEGACPLLLLA